jgi:hypothetical protein
MRQHQFDQSRTAQGVCKCGLDRSDPIHDVPWAPTAENINKLPEPVRRYIHDLETNTDPAGNTASQREHAMSLVKRIIELETTLKFVTGSMLDEAKAALERIRVAADADEPASHDDVEKLVRYFTELLAEPQDP